MATITPARTATIKNILSPTATNLDTIITVTVSASPVTHRITTTVTVGASPIITHANSGLELVKKWL